MTENLRIGDVIYIFVDPPLMVQPLLMKLTVGYLGAESFIVEGYNHTRNVNKYIKRLFIFAIASHFAYCFAFGIPFLLQ